MFVVAAMFADDNKKNQIKLKHILHSFMQQAIARMLIHDMLKWLCNYS